MPIISKLPSAYEIKQIIKPKTDTEAGDNFRILDSWAEYDENISKQPNERKLKYLMYEMEVLNPVSGEKIHFYKALCFARVIRLPADAVQSTAFMDMQQQVLTAVYELNIKLVTIIANVKKPVPIGLLYLYGVQGTGSTPESAKEKAKLSFAGFIRAMQGTFRVLEMRIVNAEELEWLRDKMFNMEYMTMVRGIPKASKTGEDGGNRGIGNKNLNPDSQGTLEELIVGMADYEYILEVLSTPVPIETAMGWQNEYQVKMTDWNQQLQGTKSLNIGVSIPMMYMANAGQSQGWSKGFTDSNTMSFGQGESYSLSQGQSLSQSLGESWGRSVGTSISNTHSVGLSQNQGVSFGESFGQNQGLSSNTSTGFSQGVNASQGFGFGEGSSYNFGQGENQSFSHGMGTSENFSNSMNQSFSQNINESLGQNMSNSLSRTANSSYGQSYGNSFGDSNNFGVTGGDSIGGNVGYKGKAGFNGGVNYSHNHSVSNGHGTTIGENFGSSSSLSNGISSSFSSGLSHSVGVGQGLSQGYGLSHGQGISENYSAGTGLSQSHSWGVNSSRNQSYSLGNSVGLSNSVGQGQSSGLSHGLNAGRSAGFGQSESFGESIGHSMSDSISKSVSTGYGETQGISHGQNMSISNGKSLGSNIGSTGTATLGSSASMGLGPSIGYSKSYQWLDQGVQDLLEILEFSNERIKIALRGEGAFYTYVYLACPSLTALSAAQAVAKSTWQNEFALASPLEILSLSDKEQTRLLYRFQAFSADPTMEDVYGSKQYKYCTVLLPQEYVAYTHLPRISEGGIFSIIQDIPQFVVPAMMEGEIYMGTVLNPERYTFDNGYKTDFDYRVEEANLMHGFFTGASRSGKTVAAMRFIAELSQVRRKKTGKRLRIVVLDPKQDWRALARFVEPERFEFYSLGNPDFRPVKINPWKVPYGVNPQIWIDGVINIYCRAYGLLERGKQMISDIVYKLYNECGVFEAWNNKELENWKEIAQARSANVCFTAIYREMYNKMEALESGGRRMGNDQKDGYARLLERLSCFSNNRRYSIEYVLYGTSEGVSIDELIGDDDVTVLESKGLESTFKNFVFGVVTSGFYKFALAHDGGYLADDQYETVLVIEEANEILIGNDTAGGGGMPSLGGESEFEQIIDQSAGFGLFIIAITQKIADMPSSIIANAGLVFAGRLVRKDDVSVVIRAIGREERIDDRDLVKYFPKMPVGQFVCKTSRNFDFKSSEPILVQVAQLNVKTPTNYELDELLATKEAKKLLPKEA